MDQPLWSDSGLSVVDLCDYDDKGNLLPFHSFDNHDYDDLHQHQLREYNHHFDHFESFECFVLYRLHDG
jgi:hypothetical protein